MKRLIEEMTAETSANIIDPIEGELMCYQSLYPRDDFNAPDGPLLAFKTTADPDTMYLHEALRQPDRKEFIKAMEKEARDQMENGNYTIIPRSEVPAGATILPFVWQMKRKRDIKTGKIKKYKARLNVDGSRTKKGVHYEETYAPVAKWHSIRTLLTMALVHGWYTKQLDFVLAHPQAPAKHELYLKIPKGFEVDGNTSDYVLKLNRNVYGQKDAGRVWNNYLVKKLTTELNFQQSDVDECAFYQGKTMYVLYTDDSILAGPDQKEIDQIVKDMKKAKLDITVEGDIQDFLGVNIEKRADGSINMTQPHLIDSILKDLHLDGPNVNTKSTPAASSRILRRHQDSEPFDRSFDYRSVIGKLNYLEKATRSDIAYITHQCARFVTDPRKEHGDAVRWLGRYLRGTRDKGTILSPDPSRGLEVYVDADFAGNWDSRESDDKDTARSRHGYYISYAGCLITWKSQLQTEYALSSTESEYTGLSYALREAIPIMELLKEMKAKGFRIHASTPKVHCRVFEDNSGALEMAKTHKFRPRTKHLNCRLHHFRDYVERREISIHPITSAQQPADILTKPVNDTTLQYLRRIVMGW